VSEGPSLNKLQYTLPPNFIKWRYNDYEFKFQIKVN